MFRPLLAFGPSMTFAAMSSPNDPRRPLNRGAIIYLLVQAAIVIALLLVFLLEPAFAQDAAATNTIDLGPMLTTALDLLGPAIGTVVALVGLWVLTRLSNWLGLKIDDSRRAAIEQALRHGVNFTIERVGDRTRGGIPIQVKHQAIYTLAHYAERAAPDAIEHFGITAERLNDMAESRLQEVLLPDANTVVSGEVAQDDQPAQTLPA